MNLANMLRGFVVFFVLVFFVSAVVSYFYSLAAHGHGVIDWASAVRLAITLGIALPAAGEFERRRHRTD